MATTKHRPPLVDLNEKKITSTRTSDIHVFTKIKNVKYIVAIHLIKNHLNLKTKNKTTQRQSN